MIQRIQTIYYLLAIVALSVPVFGLDMFVFPGEGVTQYVTLTGSELTEHVPGAKTLLLPDWSLYWGNVLVIVMLLLTILSYKLLKTQQKLGRFSMILFLLVLAGLVFIGYTYSQWLLLFRTGITPGAGLYVQIAAIIFIWLGNRGVKKDRKLLDSLNRLR